MSQHDRRTIYSFPYSNGERMFALSKERMYTPVQLLRGETYQATMSGNSGQSPAETETVGKKNIGTLHPEFLPIVFLTQHNVTDEGFGRRY